MFLGRDADGGGFSRQDVAVGVGRLAQGHRHARRLQAADAAPRGRRHIRFALAVVGFHNPLKPMDVTD